MKKSIEIIYGDYKLQKGDKLITVRSSHLLNMFLTSSKSVFILDNTQLKLSRDNILWIIYNSVRSVKILLKDKKIKFLKGDIPKLKKAQKNGITVKLTDKSDKAESIFKYLDRIAFDTDRELLFNNLTENKIELFPVIKQMLLYPDKIGNEDVLNLLDKMMFKTNKAIYEVVSFSFKPISKQYINWWSRK